jgi:hypothetical protein
VNDNQKRILQLVTEGRLTAMEADKLLSAIENTSKEPFLKVEIISSLQEKPVLELSLPLSGLKGNIAEVVAGSKNLAVHFQFGKFGLDLRKLNWQSIAELANHKDADIIYQLESPGMADDSVSLHIKVEK